MTFKGLVIATALGAFMMLAAPVAPGTSTIFTSEAVAQTKKAAPKATAKKKVAKKPVKKKKATKVAKKKVAKVGPGKCGATKYWDKKKKACASKA